jgi:Na+/pantothenate symporter
MAAVFLFADWGFRYGFGGFWVPIFWLLGYLLLYLFIPKFEPFLGKTWTLHGFLGDRFKSPKLQVIAASATILGLWGTMMMEIDYCTAVYAPVLGASWKDGGTFFLGLFFLAFGASYVIAGGYKATVNNERWQVPIAYSCFIIVILIVISLVRQTGYEIEFKILVGTMAALFGLMIFAKLNLIGRQKQEHEPMVRDSQIWIPLCGLAGLFIIYTLVPLSTKSIAQDNRLSSLATGLADQIHAQGFLALLSLFVANFFWMPVDVSTWQRISSIKTDPTLSLKERVAPIRKGIFRVMFESPVSWGFGVVFGIALKYSGLFTPKDDPSIGIQKFTEALVGFQLQGLGMGKWLNMVFPIFIIGMIAVMLSTIDELLSAITFTTCDDIVERKKGQGHALGDTSSLTIPRIVTFLICLGGAFGFYGLRYILKVEPANLLYAFYSCQLALFPTVAVSFWAKKFCASAAISSILIGIAAGLLCAFVTVKGLDLSLVSPLACLALASVTYWVVSLIAKPVTSNG